jgi:hypothetical protein
VKEAFFRQSKAAVAKTIILLLDLVASFLSNSFSFCLRIVCIPGESRQTTKTIFSSLLEGGVRPGKLRDLHYVWPHLLFFCAVINRNKSPIVGYFLFYEIVSLRTNFLHHAIKYSSFTLPCLTKTQWQHWSCYYISSARSVMLINFVLRSLRKTSFPFVAYFCLPGMGASWSWLYLQKRLLSNYPKSWICFCRTALLYTSARIYIYTTHTNI